MQPHNELRKTLKRQRQQIPNTVRHRANAQITARITGLKTFQRAQHIAAYVGSKGEINPMPLLHLAHTLGKHCYLPVLHPWFNHKMLFVPWQPSITMHDNCFAIPEPAYQLKQAIKPCFLDMVLVPLLGFDQQCHRLGMGGGFYDRTFAFRKQRQYWQQPLLVGLAFDEQHCERINTNIWDVAMDAIVTPSNIYRMKSTFK